MDCSKSQANPEFNDVVNLSREILQVSLLGSNPGPLFCEASI